MPKITPYRVKIRVLTLSDEGLTPKYIKERLLKDGVQLARSQIFKIIKNRKEIESDEPRDDIKGKFRRTRTVLTSEVLKKIDQHTNKENPLSQRNISDMLNVSKGTVYNATRMLKKYVKKKRRVHQLTNKHRKIRRTNSRKLYEQHLAGERTEFAATLDEAIMYVVFSPGKTDYYYAKIDEEAPPEWVREKEENFKDKFMVIGGLSGRGRLPLIKVPKNVKINSKVYVDLVLKPYFERFLPALYGDELHRVFVHHDGASSHTAKYTQEYAALIKRNSGITLIPNSLIPIKSCDAAPMDFFAFGYLKKNVRLRKATTLSGFWKTCREEWSRITPAMIRNTFQGWKRRLRKVHRNKGGHIENCKDIHSRKSSTI